MKTQIAETSVKVWISARETSAWAWRPGKRWPCSFLAGSRLFAEFDRNGLVDMQIDSGRGDQDCPADEFNALTSDFLRDKLPKTHPAYPVAVGPSAVCDIVP